MKTKLSQKQVDELVHAGIDNMVKDRASAMEQAMSHMKQQLTIAAGIYHITRFKSDIETIIHTAQAFGEALALKESMVSGWEVESGTDRAQLGALPVPRDQGQGRNGVPATHSTEQS